MQFIDVFLIIKLFQLIFFFFKNSSIQNETEIEQNGTTGSQSGFEPEAGSIPTPGASGDNSNSNSPNGSARNPSVRVEQGEERAISFWGALKIPVNIRSFYSNIVHFKAKFYLETIF